MAFPTTSVLDNFDRANSTGLSNANWSTDYDAAGRAAHDIVSNTAEAPGGGFGSNWWNVATYGPDCEVYATLSVMPTTQAARIHLRLNGQGTAGVTGYELECLADGTGFLKRIDGGNFNTNTVIHDFDTLTVWQVGDSMGLEAVGSTLTAYRKRGGTWAVLDSAVDANHSGAGHIHMMTQNETVARFDDFGGGTIVTTASVPRRQILVSLR